MLLLTLTVAEQKEIIKFTKPLVSKSISEKYRTIQFTYTSDRNELVVQYHNFDTWCELKFTKVGFPIDFKYSVDLKLIDGKDEILLHSDYLIINTYKFNPTIETDRPMYTLDTEYGDELSMEFTKYEIRSQLNSMGFDPTRPTLSAMYFDKTQMVCTNGHTMLLTKYDADVTLHSTYLICADVFKILSKITSKGLCELDIKFYNKYAVITIGNMTLTSRYLNHNYVAYEQLVNNAIHSSSGCELSELNLIMEKLNTKRKELVADKQITTTKFNQSEIIFDYGCNMIEIKQGDLYESIPHEFKLKCDIELSYDEIKFNYQKLKLCNMGSDKLNCGISAIQPCISYYEKTTSILMPMKIT